MTTQLEDRLADRLHDLADDTVHFHVDVASIEQRGRRLKARKRSVRGGLTLGVAALTAAAVGIDGFGAGRTPASSPSAGPTAGSGAGQPLVVLAGYVAKDAHPAGDATEVIRTTSLPGKASTVGADLFADNGEYFYTDDPAALPAAVKSDADLANGVFGREVEIARFAAAGGDLNTARQRMAVAALDPGKPYVLQQPGALSPEAGPQAKEKLAESSARVPAVNVDNSIWTNSLDALIAGAGQPEVRAGVLRILATLPQIAVTHSTTGGQAALTIASTDSSGYREALTVGAADALPLQMTGVDKDGSPDVTVTYRVERVLLANMR